MNPNVVVDGEVVLPGDYEITGPVNIKRRLTTADLLGSNQRRSLKALKESGIKLTQEVVQGDIVFNQPLQVETLSAQSVNQIPFESLLRSGNINDQIVTGRKIFSSPLVTLEADVDVVHINGVNLDEFSRTVLMKTGDQNITGNIQFVQIDAYK